MAAPSSSMSVLNLVLLFLLSSSFLISCSNAEVITLTDHTFEHQTQASTGGTTGSWLILFGVPNCRSCDIFKPLLEDLAAGQDDDEELYERGIVMGSVDCSKHRNVCFRFDTVKLPVLLYLHKNKMYRYSLRDDEEDEFGGGSQQKTHTKEDLRAFVLGEYAQKSSAEDIPGIPSVFDSFLKPIMMVSENNKLAGYAIYGMAGMMLFTILVLVVMLIIGAGSNDTKKKENTESSKKNK